jgi:glycosyltransferase involved in cell wall biosynthesis
MKEQHTPIKFAIVTTSYNNASFYMDNIKSIASQTYPDWHLYYIDDHSIDETYDLTSSLVKELKIEDKVTLIRNPKRKGSLANTYDIIQTFDPSTVVVLLDGDDMFAHEKVLERVSKAYKDKNIWMTFSQVKKWPMETVEENKEGLDLATKDCSFRDREFAASHLRTFYAKLFQLVKKEDLIHKGEFFPVCADMAFLFPMLEMAVKGHFYYIEEPLYLYNISNPINDHKLRLDLLFETGAIIRSLPRYAPLEKLFE